MTPIAFWQLLLLAVIVALIVVLRRHGWQQLENELHDRLPVFSAETTRGLEAEFIRDRLPKRLPKAVVALAVLGAAAAVIVWWLSS